jgi:glycosyltransferase involved in cell wall biosynthesis
MLLSVIIPTYKRHETLSLCLQRLTPEKQSMSSDQFEVIVSDDGFSEESQALLKRDFPWAIYKCGPQKGPAANRNNGAKAASGEWLIFLDDDCLPEPTFLSAYAEGIKKHPEYLVFEGRTLPDRPRWTLAEESPVNADGGFLWSCNFMISQKLFFEVGAFCELFPYACMEDVDFRDQLTKRGIKFVFVPEALVIHPWRTMVPEDKFMKSRLVSHEVYFTRHPQTRPGFLGTTIAVVRMWLQFIAKEGPPLKYRGSWRYCLRLWTVSKCQYINWAEDRRRQKTGIEQRST